MPKGGIAVLDFGSQYTQLIARRLRELGYYSVLFPYNVDLAKLRELAPAGIVLSGGPSSVYESGAPTCSVVELAKIAPLLGICYGMQLMAKQLGGEVASSQQREYGHNEIHWQRPLVAGLPTRQKVWMSHGDVVQKPPRDFYIAASTDSGHPAALGSERMWALQFHPEVTHTDHGREVLEGFARDLCGAKNDWQHQQVKMHLIEEVRAKVPATDHVLCALSGGVDSSVVAALLKEALGKDRLHCVFVNNGLLRKDEFEQVLKVYGERGIPVDGVDATHAFLHALKGVVDPEHKRKIIGRVFIEVFTEHIKKLIGKVREIHWLAQGTLYPDVIESVSPRGASVTIKSHHNVGGLPADLKLKLIEPLRELFKDEVRVLGRDLGLPEEILRRHPFPGPGLAVRILGEVSEENLVIVREADAIFMQELKKAALYDQVWQAFCVLLPIRTVGVQGDGRTYERTLALRAVTSVDGMTADWFEFPKDFLRRVSSRITNEVRGVNRVVYDITSKPPGTIEWE